MKILQFFDYDDLNKDDGLEDSLGLKYRLQTNNIKCSNAPYFEQCQCGERKQPCDQSFKIFMIAM